MSELLVREAQPPRTVRPLAAAGGRLVAPLGSAVGLTGLAAANGGYFATAWGWSALVLLWIAGLALLARSDVGLGRLDLAAVGALAALAAWTWLSTAWSGAPGQSVLEGQRAIVYVSGVAAVLIVARRSSIAPLLGSLLAGIAAASGYGLATRLFPDRLGSYDAVAAYRLSEPLGYWNALGIFAALGALLAVGFSVHARTGLARALAAASLVLLTPTLYFTFSRGSWIALGVGTAAAIALTPQRLRLVSGLLFVAPAPALAVWLASESEALTRKRSALPDATREGHRLALWLLALAAAAVLLSLARDLLDRRLSFGPLVRRAYGSALALVVVAGLAALLVQYGGPIRIVDRAYDAFNAPPPHVELDLTKRLFSFSGTYRADLWRAAWADFEEHPWLGSGVGTYEEYWLEHREIDLKVRDAHSIYFETLAELGVVGLGLLALVLAAPLVGAARARRHPLVPVAFGAYVAYLAHAGVDWDWEMPTVTLTALFIGAAIIVAARPDDEEPKPLSPQVRYPALAVVLAFSAVAFVGLVGNTALSESAEAARAGDWDRSIQQADRAKTWAPWSAEPYERLGEAHLARGDTAKAQAAFRRAIEKAPRDWELWLGVARASEGRERQEALAQAAKLNPLSPEIRQFRAELAAEPLLEVSP